MNRDDMIREALDFAAMELATVNTGGHGEFNRLFCVKFAALVAAAEREACAKVCEDTDVVIDKWGVELHDNASRTLGNAAATIRARGEA